MAKAKPNGLIEQTTGPDPFYRDRDAHLIEVACNGKLSGAAKSIASILAIQYANREKYLAGEKRVAWPSAETLAQDLGLNPDTVKDGLKALEVYGHHKVDRPKVKGRGRVNGYRFVVKGLANGGEKTPIKNGGEETPNSGKNGGLQPPKMGVKTPPELNEKQSEGAGARSRAPQAPEQTDVSFVSNDKTDNDQNGVTGDLGAHECPPSPDPETESDDPESNASDPEWREPCEPSEIEPPAWLVQEWTEAEESRPEPDFEDGDEARPDETDDRQGEPDAPDANTIKGWNLFFNTIAFAVIDDLSDQVEVADPRPIDLLVWCSMWHSGHRSGLLSELPSALCRALAGASRLAADGAKQYLSHWLLTEAGWDERAFKAFLNAIQAASPAPVQRVRQFAEVANG